MDSDELALARTQGNVDPTDPLSRTAIALADADADASTLGSPLRAARIGRHAILRQLGAGGMGVVYAAYDEELDRKVALKLLHGETGGDSEGQARLVREAQALARLSHPNVVQIHEIGEHRGHVFVAMEYVDGVTLDAWQRSEKRSLPAILAAYHQAGEGLQAAHRAGLVHRDFKPENVLVGHDGRIRVADFGLARRDAATDPAAAASALAADDDATSTYGAVAGTPAYMSPERFRGSPADARSDIFSFCVALWEALHGERPFAGRHVHELAVSVTTGNRRPPTVELPARLQHALERGLAVDPDARWPTMEPLLAAIAVDPDADPSSAARQRRTFLLAIGALISVFLAMFTAAAYVGEALLRTLIVAFGLLSVTVLAALVYAFRRSLLRNRYHRRVLTTLAILAVVSTSQRIFGLLHDAPLIIVMVDTVHIFAAVTLMAAIFFVRWMAVLTGLCVVAIVLAYVAPQLYPSALLVALPTLLVTLGVLWSRDAARRPA
jgi:predicted Ser/Thr protein kinase